MFYVQLFDFKLYSVKLFHTKPILITSNVCGHVRQAVFQFKCKPTIKYVKYKYKSSSQLLMMRNVRKVNKLPIIFARPKWPTVIKTIIIVKWCIYL